MPTKANFQSPTQRFFPFDYLPNDNGVTVQEALELIKYSPYADDFTKLLNVDKYKNDTIAIPGARKLVDSLKAMDQRFKKIDIFADYAKINFAVNSVDESVDLIFSKNDPIVLINTSSEESPEIFEGGNIYAVPVRDAKSDLFTELHSISNYANSLLKIDDSKYGELVIKNLDWLKNIKKDDNFVMNYRLVLDKQNDYYIRGVVSDSYKDYNNNLTVFIALITLHENMIDTGTKYNIQLCEYNESEIRVFFEKIGYKEINENCRVKHSIQLSNNEIGKGPFEFTGTASIEYSHEGQTKEILFSPKENKDKELGYSFAKIYHRYLPETAREKISLTNKITQVEQGLYNDLSFIYTIDKPDEIRFLLQQQINSNTNIKPFVVGEIKNELDNKVSNIYQLLDIMYKLELAVTDIDKKEYLRYLFYNMIKDEKTRREIEAEKKKGKKGSGN